jgi:hypothetical protein
MMAIRFERRWDLVNGWNIWAFLRTERGTRVPYQITVKELPAMSECELMQPSAVFEDKMADEFFRALIAGLQEAGKLPQMGATEAELNAVKRHLSDMRQMAMESHEVFIQEHTHLVRVDAKEVRNARHD